MGGASLPPVSIVLADSTIRGGAVLDPQDESARATHEFDERLARDPGDAIVLPLIRARVDGLAVARVTDSQECLARYEKRAENYRAM